MKQILFRESMIKGEPLNSAIDKFVSMFKNPKSPIQVTEVFARQPEYHIIDLLMEIANDSV